jgi:hypothetical protein
MTEQEMEARIDALTEMNTDMVAVVQKLTTDLNTLGQLVLLGRGRYQRGCRLCGQSGQKPEAGDPPIMEVERVYCRNGHHFSELSPDTQRMLAGEIFS